ncbi:multidrug effflux MFS transporter [Microbacterium gilvum]|uniref:Multidrug effflux MFS transporter n=1 Tax=Microbacterium gilvum TaxID=1336204 RepID=A0ABP9ALL7_9MICO
MTHDEHDSAHPRTGIIPTATGVIPVPTGSFRLPDAARAAAGELPPTHRGDALSSRRRLIYVLLLGALTALGPFTIDLYLPAFPLLERDFDTTSAAIQLTLTGTMIGFALGQLVVGPLSDKVGRRVPLLVVTALHVIASMAAAFAPSLALLGAARVLMGVGAAAGGVVAMAMVRDLFGGRRLVVMLSRLALVTGVAPVAAPLIGSALLAVIPWRGIFIVLAAYGVVMLVCAILALPETRPAADRTSHETVSVLHRYRVVLTDRVFLGVLVIGAMTFSGLFSYLSASSFLFQETYGFTQVQYGLLFAANSIGLVIGNQIAARLAARFGPQWVLAWSTASLLVSATAIIVCDQLGLGVWGIVVPLFVFMSTCGFTFPCAQVLALDRHPEAAGTAASILGATNNGIAGVISPVVGLISAASGITGTTMAVVMVGCAAIAVLSLWVVVRPRSLGQLAD